MRLLYTSRSWGVHDVRFVDAWRACGVDVEAVTLSSSPDTHDELLSRLAEFRPDVVQVGPLTAPGPVVAGAWDGPLIATSWAFDLLLEAAESDIARADAASVLRRADVIFADSEAVQAAAVRLGAEPGAIVRFPWGVDGEWLRAAPRPRTEAERFVFLTVRRHEPLYRVSDCITAFLRIAPEHPAAELWIAGSGSLTADLRESVTRSGAGDRVRFLGELEDGTLRETYRAADAYVSCSVVDGASVSLLEAMASGVLPLVSDIPGNREWIDESVGFRYPVGGVDELAELMRRSTGLSTPVRAEMARSAFRRVRRRADWQRTSARFGGYLELAVSRHDDAA